MCGVLHRATRGGDTRLRVATPGLSSCVQPAQQLEYKQSATPRKCARMKGSTGSEYHRGGSTSKGSKTVGPTDKTPCVILSHGIHASKCIHNPDSRYRITTQTSSRQVSCRHARVLDCHGDAVLLVLRSLHINDHSNAYAVSPAGQGS